MKKKRYYIPCIETVLVVEAMTIMAGSNETGFGPGVEKPGDGGEDDLDGDTYQPGGEPTHGHP